VSLPWPHPIFSPVFTVPFMSKKHRYHTAGTLNDGSSHTIGLSVGISVDLGLDLKVIASIADISASVSVETQTGTSQGAQKNCPDGPWLCTLIVLPAMVQVPGMQIPLSSEWTLNRSLGKPYTVQYLKTDGDGLGGVEVDFCACQNAEH